MGQCSANKLRPMIGQHFGWVMTFLDCWIVLSHFHVGQWPTCCIDVPNNHHNPLYNIDDYRCVLSDSLAANCPTKFGTGDANRSMRHAGCSELAAASKPCYFGSSIRTCAAPSFSWLWGGRSGVFTFTLLRGRVWIFWFNAATLHRRLILLGFSLIHPKTTGTRSFESNLLACRWERGRQKRKKRPRSLGHGLGMVRYPNFFGHIPSNNKASIIKYQQYHLLNSTSVCFEVHLACLVSFKEQPAHNRKSMQPLQEGRA